MIVGLPLCGCGGGSPSGPSPLPTPSTVPGYDVAVAVFYDEDGDGRIGSQEKVRLPDVVVAAMGRSASTASDGRATISNVPAGPVSLTVRVDSLPPFWQAPSTVTVSVPQASGTETLVPMTLAIGSNRPNRYMAFGDSITSGDGSSSGRGYRVFLQDMLTAHLGTAATVIDEGIPGTRSQQGVTRIVTTLGTRRPAYTIILYGTNDWNECGPQVPCDTVDNLQQIIQSVKAARSLPVLGTIIPANPDYPQKVPPERNPWVKAINALLRPMARQEGAALADLEAAFLSEPNLPDLFSDHVHPNDRGYQIIAEEFFKAIAGARGSSGSSKLRSFGFANMRVQAPTTSWE